VIVNGTLGPAARHGLRELRRALQGASLSFEECATLDAAARGRTLLVVGPPGSPAVSDLLHAAQVAPPQGAETTLIHRTHWQSREALLVSGGDDRGLMYALLDVADRIGWAHDGADPLSRVRDTRESPYVDERSLSIYTMHKATFLKRFHDRAYWARYLDLLARSRFNTFALLFAYESAGLFAPPYPYFFDVDGFPEVSVAGLAAEEQRHNLRSLNALIAQAHERGLDFTLGIWDHVYRGGVQQGPGQDPQNPLPWRVLGLNQENLVDYSVAALSCLLERVPNLQTIQFRMHGESGLTREEMDRFWARIYDVMAERAPGIRFDARAKGFPDHLIDLALAKGVEIRICTKYWMEQMGLPFHPTHVHPRNQMDRRHGYADLLRYPQRYKLVWRLWNGGTSRLLLWGDPQYVRRFATSTHLYSDAGSALDVNEPLATWMAGQDHDAPPFDPLRPAYRAHQWPFERYWHFYQLWGRLSYNPETPPEVWEVEFERRFGAAAGPILARALHRASRILPRIVAANYPYSLFPTTRGWVEKQRMGDLPEYAAALPSDIQQFQSFAGAARDRLEGRTSAQIHPLESSAWFARTSSEVLSLVEAAEARAESARNPEFAATVVDLRILAYLARYHARRCQAGFCYALYEGSRDLYMLEDALAHEEAAIEAWAQLVDAAGDAYAHDLPMGLARAGLTGHWRDELAALRQGLKALREERAAFRPAQPDGGPHVAHVPLHRARPGEALVVRATVSGSAPITRVRVNYGHKESEVRTLELQGREASEVDPSTVRLAPPDRAARQAAGPGGDLLETLKPGDVCQGQVTDLRTFGAFVDLGGIEGLIHISELSWRPISFPGEVLKVGDEVEVKVLNVDRQGKRIGLSLKRLEEDPQSTPLGRAPLAQESEGEGAAAHLYQARIPGDQVAEDLRYWIEALDVEGRQTTFPEGGQADPLSVIVTGDERPPTVIHEPIRAAPAGQPLTVTAQVHDPSGVVWVRLLYRSVTQFQDYRTLEMRPTGRADEYRATVPGEHLDPGWDFMYLIEAMDARGNGAIYPDLEIETPYVLVRLERPENLSDQRTISRPR